MRLINTETLILEEFIGQPPSYAVLSHTWGDDEVSYEEFASDPASARVRGRKGYVKIQKTCQLALKAGLRYAWVDTCCIDKSSSSELSEAINSMYRWYRKCDVCYAFLSDLVEKGTDPLGEALSKCRWFSRGWTLQELIAPREVYFFDRSWQERGTKTDHRAILSKITGVDMAILDLAWTGHSNLKQLIHNTPVATKMRWASKRQTTRPEDGAYCLLGIFNVHMPLLYGEGANAFRRLQEEIAKRSADLSLFAWHADWSISRYSGLFAPSAACFSLFQGHIRPSWSEFTITNTGLRAQPKCGFVISKFEDRNEDFYAWPLLVSEQHVWCVVLLRLGINRFLRANTGDGGIISKPVEEPTSAVFGDQECYMILDSIPHSLVRGMRREYTRSCARVDFESATQQMLVLDAVPQSNWNTVSRNIAQTPTALLLRIVDGLGSFNFLIFACNWVVGNEFYILDFSMPVVPYILQNAQSLQSLRGWGLEPTILSRMPDWHTEAGRLSTGLNISQNDSIQVMIERLARVSDVHNHRTGELGLMHSDNHQSRIQIKIERAQPRWT